MMLSTTTTINSTARKAVSRLTQRNAAPILSSSRWTVRTMASSSSSSSSSSNNNNNNSGPRLGEKMADMGPSVTAPHTVLQDMPPPGGFQPVRLRKNSPNKLWSVWTAMLFALGAMAYGWYKYFFTYVRHQQLEYEKYVLTDLALAPVLQAEKDIMLALERRAFRKKVAELKELDEELRNDDSFQAEWDGQFFKMAKKYTYPFNESQRYITKNNLSVTFKGTGLMQREKEYLQKLREM